MIGAGAFSERYCTRQSPAITGSKITGKILCRAHSYKSSFVYWVLVVLYAQEGLLMDRAAKLVQKIDRPLRDGATGTAWP